MQASLAELAELVDGRLLGDASLAVSGAAPLSDVQAGQITFIDSIEKESQLRGIAAAAAIVPIGVEIERLSVIQVADVHLAFTAVHRLFYPARPKRRFGISPAAVVNPSAELACDVEVHPGATVGDDVRIGSGSTIHSGVRVMAGCRIGRDVAIYPNAVLYEDTVVGDHVIIHAGAVLGAFGFGYEFVEGRHKLCAQLGNVVIEPHVEIGAGSTIDRGVYGGTRIGEGSKLDDQVMIGHNCRIGRHNLLCSQVGIAGSSKTGDYVVMGGQVGVRDHRCIGDRAQIAAAAIVRKDVPADDKQVGFPAAPVREYMKQHSALRKLPDMRRQLKRLQQTVEKLQQRIDEEGRHAA